MKDEKQTLLIERAKKFHKLWKKGYSVADAALKMGISKQTIYDQLDKYAEINGVGSRLTYIKDYSARTITEKTVSCGEEASILKLQEEFDDCSQMLEFEEILAECDKWMSITLDLIESLDSRIRVYFETKCDKTSGRKKV